MSNADRDLVVAYLHYSGEHQNALTEAEATELFCMGDGFGTRTAAELAEINSGWDWSHIRDSSPEAWARIAERLRAMGCAPDGRRH